MNTDFDEQQIKDLFNAEAQEIPPTAVSTEQIVSRGRVYKRRRGAILGVTAVVVASGVGFGAFRALQPGSDQLATSTATDGSGVVPTTAAVTSDPTPATDISGSGLSEDANVEFDQSQMQLPVPYRDGFLLLNSVPSDDALVPTSTAISFGFTADGTSFSPLGTGVEVAGLMTQPAVVGDTLLLLSSDGDTSPTLHLYWSDDLTTWSEDELDLTGVGNSGQLSPAVAELVDVELFATSVVTDGNEWVAAVRTSWSPSEAVKQRFDVSENEFPIFTSNGMMISSESGQDRSISAEELGVTKDDLAIFDDFGNNALGTVLSGRRGQTEFTSVDGPTVPSQSIVALGDRFIGLNDEAQLIESPDGSTWSPFAFALGERESVSSLATIQGDLLVLTTTDTGQKAYRVGADGTATSLGDVPTPLGSTLQQLAAPGQPIFTAASMGEPMDMSDFVMLTDDYEVTIVAPGVSGAATDEIHYVVRDRATGEVVAENTRPGGTWMMGEEIDGEIVVTFTDSEGRPDVVIASAELDAAEEQTLSETGDDAAAESGGSSEADVSASADGSVPAVDPAGLDWNQIATADGVHWYTNPDPDHSFFLAVNGNNLLIGQDDGANSTLEVVDLSTAATEQAE